MKLWWVMLLAGIILLVGSIGFASFASISRSKSDQFTASLSETQRLSDWIAPKQVPEKLVDPQTDSLRVDQFASLFPGSQVNPRYWSNPDWAGNEPFGGPTLLEGFEPTARPGQGLPQGSTSSAARIRIPSIDLDEVVEELELIDDNGKSRYEQPVNVVGHIRGTANPGENGAGWYFGHQSNFGSSEGAVFRQIPEIFDLFRKDPVYIYLDTDKGSFAYRVFGTDVVEREDLRLSSATESVITLVTSWPPLVFDQRFLVFAELVGTKRE